jgi:hypothetical protein
MPDAGCRMPDAGCRMPDAGCRMPVKTLAAAVSRDPASERGEHPASVLKLLSAEVSHITGAILDASSGR